MAGGDLGFSGVLALCGGQCQELIAQGLDLTLDGGRVERGVLGGQPALGQRVDLGVGTDPDVGGFGGVSAAGHGSSGTTGR